MAIFSIQKKSLYHSRLPVTYRVNKVSILPLMNVVAACPTVRPRMFQKCNSKQLGLRCEYDHFMCCGKKEAGSVGHCGWRFWSIMQHGFHCKYDQVTLMGFYIERTRTWAISGRHIIDHLLALIYFANCNYLCMRFNPIPRNVSE